MKTNFMTKLAAVLTIVIVLLAGSPFVTPATAAGKTLVPAQLHLQILPTCPGGAFHCVQATWSVPTVDSTHGAAASYNLYRATTSSGCSTLTAATCTKIPVAGASTVLYIDSPLAAATTYFYVLTAVGSSESAPTTQQSATTGADPAPNTPGNFNVVGK